MRSTMLITLLFAALVSCAAPGSGDAAPSGPRSSGTEREPNDSRESATEITPTAWIQGGVGGVRDDLDCYAIVPSVSGTLTFELENTSSGSEASRLQGPVLYDAAGVVVTRIGVDVARGQSAEAAAALVGGARYVLELEARDSRRTPYMLKTSFVED